MEGQAVVLLARHGEGRNRVVKVPNLSSSKEFSLVTLTFNRHSKPSRLPDLKVRAESVPYLAKVPVIGGGPRSNDRNDFSKYVSKSLTSDRTMYESTCCVYAAPGPQGRTVRREESLGQVSQSKQCLVLTILRIHLLTFSVTQRLKDRC